MKHSCFYLALSSLKKNLINTKKLHKMKGSSRVGNNFLYTNNKSIKYLITVAFRFAQSK